MQSRVARERCWEAYWPVAKRAALWLVFLAPFFYLTYGAANWLAAQKPHVGSIVYDWERAIPFMAWTIVPYWSINLFYALSLFVNDSPRQVDRLAGRYLTAQIVAVSCFIAFPLAASFMRPETTGLPGFMFAVLGGFDKPFNQAPSLHIALLVIIWDHLRHRLPRRLGIVWNVWCAVIGLSVLTTWQHHFIDIPTGALLGLFALWLFPRQGPLPFSAFAATRDRKALRLGFYYLAGAVLCLGAAGIGAFQSAIWLILLWPALALAIVAFGYFGAGPKVFQKDEDGAVTLASRLLLWPYRLGAGLNAWAWTRKLPRSVAVADGVSLGGFPSATESDAFATIVDLAAEFERPRGVKTAWISVPMLDLVPPSHDEQAHAAEAIEAARLKGSVLVCCALGFQRSAGSVAHWLIATGRAADAAAALALLTKAGRPVHLSEQHDGATESVSLPGAEQCARFASRLVREAQWPAVTVAAVAFALPLLTIVIEPDWLNAPVAAVPMLLAVAAGLAVLGLSALIRFDAALFQLMASHGDEAAAGAAVDDLLARMRLKAKPATIRPLRDRIAGTERLLKKQRIALAIFVVAACVSAFVLG